MSHDKGSSSTGDLSLDSLREAIESCPPWREPDIFGLRQPTLLGMKIHEIEPDIRPAIHIRDDFEWITPEARREMNQWLLDRFGTRDHSVLARGKALFWSGSIAMRKEDVMLLANTVA